MHYSQDGGKGDEEENGEHDHEHDEEHGDEEENGEHDEEHHDEHGDEHHDEHGDEHHDEHGDEHHDDHGDDHHDDHGEHLAANLEENGIDAPALLVELLADPETGHLSRANLELWLTEGMCPESGGGDDHDDHGHDDHGHDEHGHDEGPSLMVTVDNLMDRYGGKKLLQEAAVELATEVSTCQAHPDCEVKAEEEHIDEEPSGLATITGHKLDWLKVGVAAFFLVEQVIGIFIPIILLRYGKFSGNIPSLFNCFSAGVFLSAGILHLLPHALEAENHVGWEYSYAPAFLIAGYFLMFVIERLPNEPHSHSHAGASSTQLEPAVRSTESGTITSEVVPDGKAKRVLDTDTGRSVSHWSLLLFLIALGVHQILESVVIGVGSTARSVLLLTGAIALHKLPTHIALTTRYLRAGYTPRQLLMWLLPFCLVGPGGVLLGLAVSNAAGKEVDFILTAIGAGVFVYIGTTEVICEDFEHIEVPSGQTAFMIKFRRFLAFFLGFLVLFPAIFIPHEH